jgi:acetyl-CoA C-acetyltransferase
MISIIGYYTTQFGELWEKSLYGLVHEAIGGVCKDANIEKNQIDAVFFGNMMGGILENNLHGGAKIAEVLGSHIPVFRVESACASGGMAFHMGVNYILSGAAKTVLVVGAEKMTDFSPEQVVSSLAAAASGEEQEAGLTFPGLYAMMAQVYLQKYKYTEKNLAFIPVKNHYHGSLNQKAHFQRTITIESVLDSTYVAYPLKVMDSSPISDGASAVIISSDNTLVKKAKAVAVLATEVATDSISLKKRAHLDRIEATEIASQKAFSKANLKPEQISVAELHDCFSIAEIMAMEDIGFWKRGKGGALAETMSTQYGNGGNLIVNTSGGLKAAGHPVGATGIKQIGEVYLQLTGQAEGRQVAGANYGLAHNVGGSGGTAVVTILGI